MRVSEASPLDCADDAVLPGCRFVKRMSQMAAQQRIETLLNSATNEVIQREKARQDRYNKSLSHRDLINRWKHAAQVALRWSRAHYKDHITITEKEHMSAVDCVDGAAMRGHLSTTPKPDVELDDTHDTSEDDLITINPIVDGRLKDEGRK